MPSLDLQVAELVEQVLPLRAQAEALVTAGTALPSSAFQPAEKLLQADPAPAAIADAAVETQPPQDTAALLARVTSSLQSLKKLGERTQEAVHAFQTLAGASSDQATITAADAADRARRPTAPPPDPSAALCRKQTWCLHTAEHTGPCTALKVPPKDAVASADAAAESSEPVPLPSAQTASAKKSTPKNGKGRGAKAKTPKSTQASKKKATPAAAGAPGPTSDGDTERFENVVNPFASQTSKVTRTPTGRPRATKGSSTVKATKAEPSPAPSEPAQPPADNTGRFDAVTNPFAPSTAGVVRTPTRKQAAAAAAAAEADASGAAQSMECEAPPQPVRAAAVAKGEVAPLRRSPRNTKVSAAAVAVSSPLARTPRSKRPAADEAAPEDNPEAAVFQGRGLARTPVQARPAPRESSARSSKRRATEPAVEPPTVSPIVASALDSTFTLEDGSAGTPVAAGAAAARVAQSGGRRSSPRFAKSSSNRAATTASTPRTSGRASAKKSRTPLIRTPARGSSTVATPSRLRNSVGRV